VIEFAVNNNRRLEVAATRFDADGMPQPDTGITNLVLRLTDSDTATSALGSLSYTGTEYAGDRVGTYYFDVLGSHLGSEFSLALASTSQLERFVQILRGTIVNVVLPCVIRKYTVIPISR